MQDTITLTRKTTSQKIFKSQKRGKKISSSPFYVQWLLTSNWSSRYIVNMHIPQGSGTCILSTWGWRHCCPAIYIHTHTVPYTLCQGHPSAHFFNKRYPEWRGLRKWGSRRECRLCTTNSASIRTRKKFLPLSSVFPYVADLKQHLIQ